MTRTARARRAPTAPFKIVFASSVRAYADYHVRATSPEEAAALAEAWIGAGNVSALHWTDADGDAIAGAVDRDGVRFTVYQGGDEGDSLGDDSVLLKRWRERDGAPALTPEQRARVIDKAMRGYAHSWHLSMNEDDPGEWSYLQALSVVEDNLDVAIDIVRQEGVEITEAEAFAWLKHERTRNGGAS